MSRELTRDHRRFRVAEIEGFARPAVGKGRPGLAVSVLDSDYCWREVARYRSEDHPNALGRFGPASGDERRATVRWLAAQDAARRNRDDAHAVPP